MKRTLYPKLLTGYLMYGVIGFLLIIYRRNGIFLKEKCDTDRRQFLQVSHFFLRINNVVFSIKYISRKNIKKI